VLQTSRGIGAFRCSLAPMILHNSDSIHSGKPTSIQETASPSRERIIGLYEPDRFDLLHIGRTHAVSFVCEHPT
jgi:hypothetical protein